MASRIEREQQRGRAVGLDPTLAAEALVLMNERFEQVSLEKGRNLDTIVGTLALIWERVLSTPAAPSVQPRESGRSDAC